MLDLPTSDSIANFAATLNRYLSNPILQQEFVIRLKVPSSDTEMEKVFQKYIELKQMCEYSTHLSVLLNLGADLPSEEILMRFFSEKVFGLQF